MALAVHLRPSVRTAVLCPGRRLEHRLGLGSWELEARIPEGLHIGVVRRLAAEELDSQRLDRHTQAVAASHRQVAAARPVLDSHIQQLSVFVAVLGSDRLVLDLPRRHCHQHRTHMPDLRMHASSSQLLLQVPVLSFVGFDHMRRLGRGLARRPGRGWPWLITYDLGTGWFSYRCCGAFEADMGY